MKPHIESPAEYTGESVNIVSMTHPKIPPYGLRELHDASKRAKSYIETRNARIRYWHSQGHTLREIADACGTITHSAVARIVKRDADGDSDG